MRRSPAAAVALTAVLLAVTSTGAAPAALTAVVASVADGDTLSLTSGERVRLLQIDAPEVSTGECYARASRAALLRLVPVGSSVTLQTDPRLDKVDRFGRLLRYVRRGALNVNVELVRVGAAAPYFFGGDRGRYADRLLVAAFRAKAGKRGLWGASPDTELDPFRQVDTGTCGSAPLPLVPGGCDPNYAGACVPPYPPDVDCGDLRDLGLALPVRVVGSDPHRLDGDHDRLGCEPTSRARVVLRSSKEYGMIETSE
jgi:endonuclease YncB( thermonuclease family)